ncbi:dienelactone hydrolase family protein [Altererythrobacter arenosus]|uniref:Dienelactone hydrolase family protein n=1 Tax=Altererythrobacter arenosus TaxID=3032592 RepID=A0ABY8FRT6_9SPHN|nr:dienelactone hydrolase family protein [Altererythrobacter sp. CAU 1644]WFL77727.1 dienelactone hydrolase family protein [Altererythrobacter sp. CAU 1644]
MANSQESLKTDDPLTDFEPLELTFPDHEGNPATRRVYRSGEGPAVVVMHEMPGLSPHVARFARWTRDAGFTVWMPSLFGRDGAVPEAKEGGEVFRRMCVAREFNVLAGKGASPVTVWLRALARFAHMECGGRGVGAVGMCFTGNFALTMMLDESVLVPVLSQPSLPLDNPAALESDADELAQIRERIEREDLSVLAYRFEGDRICQAARFEAYRAALGPRFIGKTLPDVAANSDVSPFFAEHVNYPHSVLTQHLIDAAGEPTVAARDEIIAALHARLT